MIRSALALMLVAVALFPAAARAETFTVNTTADTAGAAGCTAVLCTIRNAISAAAATTATDDIVVVPAGVYVLDAQFGALSVPTGITIRGAGANATTIRPSTGALHRVLIVNGNAVVALSDLQLRDGNVGTAGNGGNLQALAGASVALTRVRLFNGRATRGGGLAISGAGGTNQLSISQSLIDGNAATGTTPADSGGGLYVEGATGDVAVTITESTITGNSAANGGGVGMANNSGTDPVLHGVTLTRNNARAGQVPGIGGIASPFTSARIQGSIIGGNTSTINLAAGQVQIAANCALASAAVDEGGNVSFDEGATCGLGGVHADPQLAPALDDSQPPVLTIPANSSAVNIADCRGRAVDQRGVPRPQGGACDAGAYEYQPPPPQATPTPTLAPTPGPTPPPSATPPPTPEFHRTVVVRKVRGTIRVRRPGSSRFEDLDAIQGIPLGSTIDAKRGTVEITSVPQRGGTPERAQFYAGIFKITQPGSITQLALSEALASCSTGARPAQNKPKSRKLWGDGKGKFRTKGRYSAATIRGTKWLVQDSCSGTLTRVTQGSVLVRDSVRKRNVVVRKGKRYLARPRR